MKIKLDENMPESLATQLGELGHDVHTVRLRSPGRKALAQAVANAFVSEDVSSWQGCVVVLTERKIRIQRP